MIAAAGLLAYAVLLLAAGVPALVRARWPDRAPRLAVAAWFTVTGSAVASVILGGLALLVPNVRVSAGLGRLLTACVIALRAQYAHPGGAALAAAGAVLAVAVTARVAWCAAATLARAARGPPPSPPRAQDGRPRRPCAGRGHCGSRPARGLVPAGAARSVVLTTAAIAALDQPQLAAVLAHERAHQRGRHHLLVSLAGSLAVAFPRVPAFRHGHEQVARLTELLADDAAATASHRLTLAGALLTVGAGAPAGAAALGAGGSTAAARIRRLIAAPAPLSRAAAAAGMLAVVALAAVPLALLAGPAAAGKSYCPHSRVTAAAPAAPRPAGLHHHNP